MDRRIPPPPPSKADVRDMAVDEFRKLALSGASWSVFPHGPEPKVRRPAAYHLLSTSLESFAIRPKARVAFAASIGKALGGFVSMEHYRQASREANDRRDFSESRLMALIEREAANDLNPIGRCFLGATSLGGVMAMHRSILQLGGATLRTEFAIKGGALLLMRRFGERGPRDATRRVEDPLSAVDVLVSGLSANRASAASSGSSPIAAVAKVSDLAAKLGLKFTAANDVAVAFESEPRLKISELAAQLGCQLRTLQRELASAGVAADQLRRAAMLSGATSLLPTGLTLTEIAQLAGYADHAHMTRAFVAACGLPPSQLRKAFA